MISEENAKLFNDKLDETLEASCLQEFNTPHSAFGQTFKVKEQKKNVCSVQAG